MTRWGEMIAQLQRTSEAYVLVTVIGTRGSTPRETGSKMVVTAENSYDTIGGGHLEFKAIARARELLLGHSDSQTLEQYPLGATLGQCCGGEVSVLFEYFAAVGKSVLVFGAGHVAKALVPLLAELPLRVTWIDSRAEQFPETIPVNVEKRLVDDPVAEVDSAEAGVYVLILTHNHQLDYELTEAALKRGDTAFVGVIGSDTKARRFRQRLAYRQFDQALIEQMTCPVGLPEIQGKQPMEVAVSIAGQLIALYQADRPAQGKTNGIDWRTLKETFAMESDHVEKASNK
ncbi:xanthine dehydrogenase accessory protein XdhC [Marinomonas piezotolerans]|uniref:Xanthine dehydrogenase accessory protein XdhC n=1 Tax=Marinomonas piezotolerans TaxID=2213058 RepID=A0A370UC67_9GAMM|nr:xanthine dehydrogenase accessory protein XdhC [Marinomonas piezotolerans]RDL45396.1 xanthine dehydrogenase accessory protein XdhC [Marinomonas piezotolerans]